MPPSETKENITETGDVGRKMMQNICRSLHVHGDSTGQRVRVVKHPFGHQTTIPTIPDLIFRLLYLLTIIKVEFNIVSCLILCFPTAGIGILGLTAIIL